MLLGFLEDKTLFNQDPYVPDEKETYKYSKKYTKNQVALLKALEN
jgi:hypothetical protein